MQWRRPLDFREGLSVPKMRRQAEQAARLGQRLFDSKLPVSRIENELADNIPVRIYFPASNTPRPAIVYFHGGGFALYGLDSHDWLCRRLCHMNDMVVISVDYRLAPEHTFPAAHEDAWNAFQWVVDNARRLSIDPSRIAVAGDSAGGNLSACLAHRCRKEGVSLWAQLLLYPFIDGRLKNPSITRNGQGYLLTREALFWFQKTYVPREEDRCLPEVSPCFETEFSKLAPALILTAQYDPLLDDGFLYAEQLRSAGVRVSYREYPRLVHGFMNIPFVAREARWAFDDIYGFLRSIS